ACEAECSPIPTTPADDDSPACCSTRRLARPDAIRPARAAFRAACASANRATNEPGSRGSAGSTSGSLELRARHHWFRPGLRGRCDEPKFAVEDAEHVIEVAGTVAVSRCRQQLPV